MKSAILWVPSRLTWTSWKRNFRSSCRNVQRRLTEPLAEVKTQLTRLDNLVQDYLSLARIASLQREPTDMGAFVDTFLQEGAPQVARCGVTLLREGYLPL